MPESTLEWILHGKNAEAKSLKNIHLSPSSEASEECAVRVENLDAIIAGICDVNVAFLVHWHAPTYEIQMIQ